MKKLDELMKLASMLKGLTVLGCRPSSPAAQAGVRYGDILLSVNGAPTPDWTSFVKARNESGPELDLVLFRDGVTQEIKVHLSEQTGPMDPASLMAELIEHRLLIPEPGSDRDDPEPS